MELRYLGNFIHHIMTLIISVSKLKKSIPAYLISFIPFFNYYEKIYPNECTNNNCNLRYLIYEA